MKKIIKRFVLPDRTSDGIPPEPGVERIPVKIDRRTTIYVKKGCDIEEHVRKVKERDSAPPGYILWD